MLLIIMPCILIECFYIERYFLMLWAAEEVSVHKEDELKAKDQDSLIVGNTASCRFGKNFYEGKIIGAGKNAKPF